LTAKRLIKSLEIKVKAETQEKRKEERLHPPRKVRQA